METNKESVMIKDQITYQNKDSLINIDPIVSLLSVLIEKGTKKTFEIMNLD